MRAFISADNNINALDLLEISVNNLKELPNAIEEYTRSIFYSPEIREFIINANKELLEQGIRPDGSEIEKTPVGNQKSNLYERKTIYARREKKFGYDKESFYQTQFVDLKKSGFFYKSLQVRAGSNELLEFSSDPKSEELYNIWGNILGISNEDLDYLSSVIVPKIVRFVNEKLRFKK